MYLFIYVPRAPMTSIFEGRPSKTRPFPIKTRVIWVLGIYHVTNRYPNSKISRILSGMVNWFPSASVDGSEIPALPLKSFEILQK